jgi:hypothetical protein
MHIRIALLCSLLFAAAASAAEREIEYAQMHKMFARVAALQGGKYFRAEAKLQSKDEAVPTDRISLVIRSKAGDIPVAVAPDGKTDFPLRADLLEENPPVVTNVAKGKLSMSVSTDVVAPPVERFPYSLLVEMSDEAEAVIAKQGMMTRMFAPDFEGLEIRYPSGTAATATVESADGAEEFTTDAEGIIVIPDRKQWRKENPFVQLSAMPLRVSLAAD